ncbi:MAG: tRNA (guanosine(37)-N1)-methyltransferase TrmD [Candidatus Bipolaricaulota bacterium]|nr:tRNA (guanosine(37)-N1)-methyltransferase TrmD [Candidatus Bipolaricaulota bacterium]MBS3791485.1 tRNA (guanosine(37)-N1)-methyltransferase TrmD [Candidatus Bipolaricaulota bacterium]
MIFDVLTIFPEILEGLLNRGVIAQARKKGRINLGLWDLRDFAEGPHRNVDDRPYGGGPGMVMKPEPFYRGVRAIKSGRGGGRVILLSSRGKLIDQSKLEDLVSEDNLILLAGRYEGVDERVTEICDDRLSLGDFVLSGGEVPAAALIEGVGRLVDGVLGNERSAATDSFSNGDVLGPPQYTRPREFEGMEVPEVLLSGDHEKVDRFRKEKALRDTEKLRPDLLEEEE